MDKSYHEHDFYILFVDDEEIILRSLSKIYKNNFQILTAPSVDDAIKKLEANKIAIAIVDFDMPEKNGLELLKIMEGNFPIVRRAILTGNEEVEVIKQAINEGIIHSFLNKPINLTKLDEMIETQIEIFLKGRKKKL